MKRIIISLVFVLMLAVPTYAHTIINVPLDGRPVSDEYLAELAKIGNDDYISVSKKNLDFFPAYEPDTRKGNSENVRSELDKLVSEHNNKATTVIINTSSYITNGLVGSRCGSNYGDYKEALSQLHELAEKFPEPRYYVNIQMPRSLPETRFNTIWCNDERLRGLAYYYLKYNEASPYEKEISAYTSVTPEQYIMEFSYVVNKAEELGVKNITPWEREFLNYFNNNIRNKAPYKQYVDDYIKPYEASADMFRILTDYMAEGCIDEIVISNDDLQVPNFITYCFSKGFDWVQSENGSPMKYSYARTYMESGNRSIHRAIKDKYPLKRLGDINTGKDSSINIIYGTDEVPQLIYARDYTRRCNVTPKTEIVYNDTRQNTATFDVKAPGNLARAALSFVNGTVANYAKSPACVYIYDYRLKKNTTDMVTDKLAEADKKGAYTGLIELFDGTASNTVFKEILRGARFSLPQLDMYCAWNTNGNAIGLGMAQIQVYAAAMESSKATRQTIEAQLKCLIRHAVEDGLYTKSGKLALSNKGYRPDVADRTDSKTLHELMDTSGITSALEGAEYSILGRRYTVRSAEVTKLSFPWGRIFDIYVDSDIELERTKNE